MIQSLEVKSNIDHGRLIKSGNDACNIKHLQDSISGAQEWIHSFTALKESLISTFLISSSIFCSKRYFNIICCEFFVINLNLFVKLRNKSIPSSLSIHCIQGILPFPDYKFYMKTSKNIQFTN